ncbi:hypothetical protein [Yersinia intermedia]|uniref:hypothetical protein n=1 Tax=Yersinia intermedia TaxID=631 RepID=UPI001F534865|nr:hypothetical protein [Yersinia intermedia]UNK22400.1 hypothetical protein MNQ97_16645 [Yersinia intermedia]
MKIKDMEVAVQVVAAQTLAGLLQTNGTDNSTATAEAVKAAFERLYSNGGEYGSVGPDMGMGSVGGGIENKMSALDQNLGNVDLGTLMWTVNCLISGEVRALRAEVYQLLLASQK